MVAESSPGDHKVTCVSGYYVRRIGRDFGYENFNFSTTIWNIVSYGSKEVLEKAGLVFR